MCARSRTIASRAAGCWFVRFGHTLGQDWIRPEHSLNTGSVCSNKIPITKFSEACAARDRRFDLCSQRAASTCSMQPLSGTSAI